MNLFKIIFIGSCFMYQGSHAMEPLKLDQDILNFSGGANDPGTKKIMRLLQQKRPDIFVQGAENITNKHGDLAYHLGTDAGVKPQNDCPDCIDFDYDDVDLSTGTTTTYINYCGNGYWMYVGLTASHRVFTDNGKKFFRQRAQARDCLRGKSANRK